MTTTPCLPPLDNNNFCTILLRKCFIVQQQASVCFSVLFRVQCDQIVFSRFVYLHQWKFAQNIHIVPKWVKNFAQNQINLKFIAKYFYKFAWVVEFR